MKVDTKPRGFVSLEDAMRELQQRHAHRARVSADDIKPLDQGEVALRVQLPELIEVENTVRELSWT